MPSAETSYQRIIQAVEQAGLNYRELESGKRAQVQTPGHSDRDLGTSITYNGKQTLIFCHNGDTDDVLAGLGLELRDLFDNPTGASYDYGDNRIVHRSPEKAFNQIGNTKGTNLYGLPSLGNPGPVYVVEGEKDADTVAHVWGAAAVTQAQGANTGPERANWAPLAGRDIIIVADKDKPGRKRADKVLTFLTGMEHLPESVVIVQAVEGKDISDHIAAGHTPDELTQIGDKTTRRRVKLVKTSSIKTERVDWLINEWIPAGMLTLLAGREGIGKSTIACDWVAQFSNKGMKCAYLNSEDSRSFTVKPRLQAAGANLDNVYFIDVETETGSEGHLRLPQDTRLLFEELVANDVRFVVLDAAKSSMDPKLDGYKDDHVRQFLEPLAAAADRYNITIVGLAHFGKAEGKDTGRLLLGSIAWSQIARSVLSAAVDEDGRLIVSNTKGNLARGIVSREASIVSRPVALDDGSLTELGAIEWGEFTDTAATELLDRRDDEDQGDRTDAEVWLEDYLTDRGPTPRAEVIKAATKASVASVATIKRAFKKMGGISDKAGFPRVATWSLPSRVTSPVNPPRTCESEPTEPTGHDLQKHNEPTGQIFQLGHAQEYEPTGEKTAQSTPEITLKPDITQALVSVLHPEFGQSPRTINGSLTTDQAHQIQDLDAYLGAMCERGLITRDPKGRYIRNKESA
ncbi:AAA family ATPase [Corynebacterium flavescens]|uniref:AAA family ATPase n=1 Tax=Corynebacterium flavescens TaxID=28028 RepID=UPI003FD3120A